MINEITQKISKVVSLLSTTKADLEDAGLKAKPPDEEQQANRSERQPDPVFSQRFSSCLILSAQNLHPSQE